MPTLRFGQEAERALKLLVGLRQAPAAAIMSRYGFAEADRLEGWRCLQAVATARRPRRARIRPGERLLERLEAWKGVWFPVANTALRERFPAVHAWLFRDLPQAESDAVLASVAVFLQRLLRMQFEPALGTRGADAREQLARLGIDGPCVRIASELLELVSTEPDRDLADDPSAEAALRSWYLQWSEIARVAIKDRDVLRALGFGSSS